QRAHESYRPGRVVWPIVADSILELGPQALITGRQPWTHSGLELLTPRESAVLLLHVVRYVEDSIGKADEDRSYEDCLRPCAVNRTEHFLQVVESIGAIPVRRDHGLVLDRNANLV